MKRVSEVLVLLVASCGAKVKSPLGPFEELEAGAVLGSGGGSERGESGVVEVRANLVGGSAIGELHCEVTATLEFIGGVLGLLLGCF